MVLLPPPSIFLGWLAGFVMHQLVDGILRQQKAEREGAEKEAEKGESRSKGFIDLELIREDLARQIDEDSDSTNEESATPNRYSGSSSTPRQIQEVPVLSKLRNGQGRRQPSKSLGAFCARIVPPYPDRLPHPKAKTRCLDSIKYSPFQERCLANNIDMAIKACVPERSGLLWNRAEMQMVRESLDEGYCDVTGRTA